MSGCSQPPISCIMNIILIQLIGGCEQPEITHQKTLIDSLQINTNDEINDWNTDTTTYHTTTKPTK
ncbi:hypothetical protein [Parabacteroides distasonis]|uniref:hypothetical protein n=1 Tax=Parabacteroides distasonis TaxID=823 RepID=UPI00293C1176|nr:hypothetical protein [Parabacteroides distasonis]